MAMAAQVPLLGRHNTLPIQMHLNTSMCNLLLSILKKSEHAHWEISNRATTGKMSFVCSFLTRYAHSVFVSSIFKKRKPDLQMFQYLRTLIKSYSKICF